MDKKRIIIIIAIIAAAVLGAAGTIIPTETATLIVNILHAINTFLGGAI